MNFLNSLKLETDFGSLSGVSTLISVFEEEARGVGIVVSANTDVIWSKRSFWVSSRWSLFSFGFSDALPFDSEIQFVNKIYLQKVSSTQNNQY